MTKNILRPIQVGKTATGYIFMLKKLSVSFKAKVKFFSVESNIVVW